MRFREKSAKINSALINFEKINSLKVIFKAKATSLNLKIKLFLPAPYIDFKILCYVETNAETSQLI